MGREILKPRRLPSPPPQPGLNLNAVKKRKRDKLNFHLKVGPPSHPPRVPYLPPFLQPQHVLARPPSSPPALARGLPGHVPCQGSPISPLGSGLSPGDLTEGKTMWIFVLKASSFHFRPFLYPELVFSECIKMSFLAIPSLCSCLGSCFAHARSPVTEWGPSKLWCTASHCRGFSGCGAHAL